MKVGSGQHLTYCLNVHAGESWDECLSAIERYALEVRRRVAPGISFGLGLRLSRIAADELIKTERMSEFRDFLAKHDLYVFTINGFPYGQFHDTEVKERVYDPDWCCEARVTYTNLLADILSQLLPQGVAGSISTVPGGYGKVQGDDERRAIEENLASCASHFAEVEAATGRHVMLALEPEPDCLFDSTDSVIDFFDTLSVEAGALQKLEFDWRRYIGVCLDTCHFSVVFDNLPDSLRRMLRQGIMIAKVQISSALRADTGRSSAEKLAEFAEATYLHQVRIRHRDGSITAYPDLNGEALAAVADDVGGEVRVHMHVPLYFEEYGVLRSTGGEITEEFFREVSAAGIAHLEIETYTFDVLPCELAAMAIEESIEQEFAVVAFGGDFKTFFGNEIP
jgi:sugar phosphate isomerase/epimerase